MDRARRAESLTGAATVTTRRARGASEKGVSHASRPGSVSAETALEADAPQSAAGRKLAQRAGRSAAWVALGYGGAQAIRFVGNLILTRLLFEEAFGLMALIASVLQGLELFSDFGIGPSIIQNKRDDRGFLDTAFTVQVARGLVLFSIACALAGPLSQAYGEPRLAWLLPLCAVSALLVGFQSTNWFTLNRALDLGRVEMTLIAAQAAGFVTMVIWALRSPTVMALVAGSLVSIAVRVWMTHAFLPGARNRFAWEKGAIRELVRFGRWIFVSTLLGFLAGQSDRLIFGKMVSMERLGVYSIGMGLAMMPSEALAKLALQVVFPLFSERVREADGTLLTVFRQTRAPLLVLGGWAFAGLVAGGPTAVEMLYDDRYLAAGRIVQLISLGAWFFVLGAVYGAVLLALGVPKWNSAGAFAKVLAMAALIPLGYYAARSYDADLGFEGAVLGFAAAEVFRYVVTMWAAQTYGIRDGARDVWLTLMVVATGLLGAAGAEALGEVGVHVVGRAAAVAVGVTLAWLPIAWPHVKRRLRR